MSAGTLAQAEVLCAVVTQTCLPVYPLKEGRQGSTKFNTETPLAYKAEYSSPLGEVRRGQKLLAASLKLLASVSVLFLPVTRP